MPVIIDDELPGIDCDAGTNTTYLSQQLIYKFLNITTNCTINSVIRTIQNHLCYAGGADRITIQSTDGTQGLSLRPQHGLGDKGLYSTIQHYH